MRFLFILILVISVGGVGYSQTNVPFEKDLFKDRKEGFKEAVKAIKEGDKIIEEKRNHDEALPFYKQAAAFNPDNDALNFKIGECYIYSNTEDKHEAIQYFKKSYKLNPNYAKSIHYYLGIAYHFNSEPEKAIEEFTTYKSHLAGPTYAEEIPKIDKKIKECKNAIELMKNPVRVFVDNLGQGVNSPAPEYGPVITADESMMFYTSRRADTYGSEIDEGDNHYFEDIYQSYNQNKKWQPSKNAGEDINTKNHDATVGLSADGNKLLIYKGENSGDIFECFFVNGKWSKPERLPKTINTKYRETSASLSPDGYTLYFVSNREDMTLGGLDIFKSQFDPVKKKWGDPVNLGAVINTAFDEEGVFIHPDGKTLYFSSEGHNTMGGYDIFKSVYEKGRWSTPVNIGYPINTPDDDVFFVVNASGKRGYYASAQKGGYGEKDLYSVTILGPEKPVLLNTEDRLLAGDLVPVPKPVTEPPVKVISNQLTLFKGHILDSLTKQPLQADVILVDNINGTEIGRYISDKVTGKFLVPLPSGKNYNITVKAEGYLFRSENFNIPEGGDYQVVEKDIPMQTVQVGNVIVLNNIFFDYDKATLRPESNTELTNLIDILTQLPALKIEISGHTDSKGSDDYNLKLSDSRAKAVVDYLTAKGISVARLEYKGYGETMPVATNDTDEGRQLNRRTEFKVLAK